MYRRASYRVQYLNVCFLTKDCSITEAIEAEEKVLESIGNGQSDLKRSFATNNLV